MKNKNSAAGASAPSVLIDPPPDPAQYGPAFYVDNLIMRRDDKPTPTYVTNNVVAPGFGRGN